MPHQKDILFKFLAAATLSCAQIILSELILGLSGYLYLPLVISVNLLGAAVELGLCRRLSAHSGRGMLLSDIVRAKNSIRAGVDTPIIVLGILVSATYGWILVADYFLPPRGIDDLTYHLPAVFEYVSSHEIRLLPLNIQHLAFPQNAELLFLWPVLFTHDQIMVDAVNIPFILLSVVTIYALARHFSFPKSNSIFVSMLYAVCPVVMMQAGVSYVDIIVSLFLLLSLYFSLRFFEHERTLDLYMAGLSIGLMCGMKYTAPFLALPLLLLLLPPLLKGKRFHVIGFLAIISLAGGWWYLRNAWLLGAPLFPINLHAPVPDGYVNLHGGSILQNIRYNLPYWISRYPLWDTGIGTHDGGFGLIFWGMCVTSWGVAAFRAFTFDRSGLSKIVVLSYLPAGFLLLLSFPPRFVNFNGRLAMFVVPMGLLALNEVFSFIEDKVYTAILKCTCIVLTLITLSLLTVSASPSFGIKEVFADKSRGRDVSEFKYIKFFSAHNPSWELLDLLTRREGGGLNCVIAANREIYWPSPVYGSRLQNRVMNMNPSLQGPVDVYSCSFSLTRLLGQISAEPNAVGFSGQRQTILDVLANASYVPVVHTGHTCLLLRREIYEIPDNQKILLGYYRDSWPKEVEIGKSLEATLEPNIPVITANTVGYGVRFADIVRGRENRVYLAYGGGESILATMKNIRSFYTFQKPATGYRSQLVFEMVNKGKTLTVFLNKRS